MYRDLEPHRGERRWLIDFPTRRSRHRPAGDGKGVDAVEDRFAV